MKNSVKYFLLACMLLLGVFSQAYDAVKADTICPVAESSISEDTSPSFELCDTIITEIPASRPEKAVFKMDVAESEVEEEDFKTEKDLGSDSDASAIAESSIVRQLLCLGKVSSHLSRIPYASSYRYLLLKVFRI